MSMPRTLAGRVDSDHIHREWLQAYCGWGAQKFNLPSERYRRRHPETIAEMSDEVWFKKNARRIA